MLALNGVKAAVPLSLTGIPTEEKPNAGPENGLSWLSNRSPPSWLASKTNFIDKRGADGTGLSCVISLAFFLLENKIQKM